MDDDWGPTYNVRMRRGQGYNSYIEEPRIDNAVLITPKTATAPAATGKAGDTTTTSAATLTEATPGIGQTAERLTMDDFFSTLLERMGKGSEQSGKAQDAKSLPYLLRPSASARLNQTVLFSSNEIKSAEDIDKAIGFNASAKIKAGSIGPGVESGSNLATSNDVKMNDLNFLIHVKVVNESVDKAEDWTFNPVANLKERLERMNSHNKAVEFTRIYGDTFISDFVEGGEIYAWVGIQSQDKKHISHLRTYASAQLTPAIAVPVEVAASADFNRERHQAYSQAQTSIRVQWRGGGEIKTHDFRWGMDSLVQIANAFPSFVAVTPAKIRAILTPYTSLKSFQDVQTEYSSEPLTLNYDQCGLYTSTLYEDFMSFKKMCAEINDMIENPSGYTRRRLKTSKDRDDTPHSPDTATVPRIKIPRKANRNRRDPWSSSPKEYRAGPGPSGSKWPDMADIKAVQAKPKTGRKYPLVDVDTILADRQFPEMEPMDADPQRLSTMRLICRSAMIYIQEQAAALVIDPSRCLTLIDNENPLYVSQRYPCPGTLSALLPIPIRDRAQDEEDLAYKALNDLKLPREIYYPRYYWVAIGDRLSQYKDYEHFQLGDFDPNGQQYPHAIAIQAHSSKMRKYFDKATRDAHNAIAGLAFKYRSPPPSLNDMTRINVLGGGKTGSELMTTLSAGKKPVGDDIWQQINDVLKRTPPINRICVYHKPGSGMISGLEFICEADPDGHEVSPGVVASHKAFDFRNGDRDDDLMEGMEAETCYPGDSEDVEGEKAWMFAGLVGAFEKVGPFKRDRVLAKIAVIWRRKSSPDDTVPDADASDRRKSVPY